MTALALQLEALAVAIAALDLPPRLAADLAIDPTALDAELERQPDLVARYGLVASDARTRADRARLTRDRERVRARQTARTLLGEQGVRVTEAAVDDVAAVDPGLLAAEDAYVAAEAEARAANALALAVAQRLDALRMLAARKRRAEEVAAI